MSRHQLSGIAVTIAHFARAKWNQGLTSGIVSYQNGRTPAYLEFQALAILFHKRNGNKFTGKRIVFPD